MNDSKKHMFFCSILCVFAILLDQASKWSVLAFLPREATIRVFEGLNIILTFNFGTSFGLLNPSNHFEYYLIIAITISCVLFLLYVFFNLKNQIEQILCAIIIGGAIGNILDRFFHKAVVDFIDIYYKTWHWPAFNFADIFISTGSIAFVLYSLFQKK